MSFTDLFDKFLFDPRQVKVDEWLRLHGKGDFHECTWAEIGQAFAYAGIDSPLVTYAERIEKETP